MSKHQLTLSEDEAIVLFELFERFEETNSLKLEHAAEWIAIQKLSGQIDKTTSAMFDPKYDELLKMARERISDGFEDEYPNGTGEWVSDI